MRKQFWTVLILVICVALVFSGCNKKEQATEKDNTRGGVMGDIYLTVSAEDTDVCGVKVSALQTDAVLTQSKYANVYELGGKLNYQKNFTAYSQNDLLKNGFYFTFDVNATPATDLSKATFTVQSGAEGILRSFSGADFTDGKLTVTERIVSSDGTLYDNIYVTFDLDGEGTDYAPETYTIDLSGVDATLRVFAFGEYVFSEYYSIMTLEEFIERGQKLVTLLDYVGFSSTTTSSTIDMYELFSNPSTDGDYTFSKMNAATNTQKALEGTAYDYIILESGRYYPVKDEARQKKNIDAALKLYDLAVKLNPNASALIVAPSGFQTFFSDYFPINAYTGTIRNNSAHVTAINKRADEVVAKISEKYGADAVQVSYVGKAFLAYGDAATVKADLYSEADDIKTVATNANQSSALGAYLTAATMYADMFKTSPVGVNALGYEMEGFGCNLDGDDAKLLATLDQYQLTPYQMALKLQKVAHKSVFGTDAADVQYTSYFESNGGSAVAPVTAALGAKITAPQVPVRDGYIFQGWFRNKELDQKVEFVYEEMQLGGTTYYAAWKKAGETSYTIEHYIEGNDGKYTLYKTDSDRVAQADSLVYGTLFGVPGYVYNPAHPDGRASAYASADGKAKIKLYYDRAEYTITYTYSMDYKGMPNLPETATAKFGETVTTVVPSAVDDYSFTGWKANNAKVIGNTFTMPAGDVTLVGDWYETALMPTVKVTSSTELLGKQVSALQTDITVDGYKVFGHLNHITDYTGYTATMDTSTMIQPEYVEAKYGYGNYVALNFTFPANLSDDATITFTKGTDERTYTAKDGRSFDIVIRIMDTYKEITFEVDGDGAGSAYMPQEMILDLSGLTKDNPKGFEEVYYTALAYKARGAAFQYDSLSMSRRFDGSSLGQMRYDELAPAEMASWQYTLQLDCSSWMLANFVNAIGYNFEGGYDCATFCSMPTTNAYYHINTNKETDKEKDAIMAEWRSILQPGDVMVYRYANGAGGHVMLYIGDNKMIHCSGDGYYDGGTKNSHTGEVTPTLTGKAYDVDEASGAMPIDKITTLMQHDTRLGMMSSAYPKGRFAIIRPYTLESNSATPYGTLHTTYPDLYIEKTTSHPQGHSVAIGEEFTMYITFDNRGAQDITLEIENLIPQHSKLVKGEENQTVKLNSYDSKTIEVTYVIENSVFGYFEENFTRRLYFGTKVNGAEINEIAIQVGSTLTDEQIAKLQSVDFSAINASESFELIKAVYKQAFSCDLQFDGSTTLSEMISKVLTPIGVNQVVQIPYAGELDTDTYKQLVDGLYGGLHIRSADDYEHKYRIKKLTSLNLQPGDILTVSGQNRGNIQNYNTDAQAYLYIGDSKFLTIDSYGKLQTVYADGYTQYFLKTNHKEIYLTDMLAQLPGEACYFILRPAQIMN